MGPEGNPQMDAKGLALPQFLGGGDHPRRTPSTYSARSHLKALGGLCVNRITRAWERHVVLAPGQHGFRPGRGTDSALLQFLNATEHAVEAQIPLYLSSWDIRIAFDSVSREAMEVSWLRLGIPPAVARWLAYMDVKGANDDSHPMGASHLEAAPL